MSRTPYVSIRGGDVNARQSLGSSSGIITIINSKGRSERRLNIGLPKKRRWLRVVVKSNVLCMKGISNQAVVETPGPVLSYLELKECEGLLIYWGRVVSFVLVLYASCPE